MALNCLPSDLFTFTGDANNLPAGHELRKLVRPSGTLNIAEKLKSMSPDEVEKLLGGAACRIGRVRVLIKDKREKVGRMGAAFYICGKMKKYYIHNGTEQEGPFDLDDLKGKITRDTLIWYEGAADWTKADDIEDLKSVFSTPPPLKRETPPPIPNSNQNSNSNFKSDIPKKKNRVVRRIITLVIVVAAIIVGLIILDNVNRHNSDSNDSGNTYQEKVMTVLETEEADPTKFLEANGTYNDNFWGDKIKIHGSVSNNATVANYKDVVVEVTFYSSTKSVIETERYTIYDYFTAHSKKGFELKISKYKATNSVGWEVVSAIPY